MRQKRSASALVLLASLMLVGAGCNQKANVNASVGAAMEPREQRPATAPPVAQPSAPANDICGNPYYPFKAGLAVTYGVSTSPSSKPLPDYTLRVVSVTGSTATLRVDMENSVGADLTADCANGTVALKGVFDLGTVARGMKVKSTVVSQTGTYLPADVAVGSTWSNAQTIKVEMTEGPGAGMGPITTSTSTENKAVGTESVTVPAGTYEAMKVEVKRTTTSDIPAMPAGMKLPPSVKPPTPPPTVTTSTEWWVKGIGLVKNVSVSQGTTTTVVAKSVSGQ